METNNYKSTLKDIKYEFECPNCEHDLLLACYPVICCNSFNRITKITCKDKEDNVVDIMYAYGDTEEFDLEDMDEPTVFRCQHCKKTWTSLKDMIEEGIIKLID